MTQNPANIGIIIKELFPHRTYTLEKATGGFSGKDMYLLKFIITKEELRPFLVAIDSQKSHHFYFYTEIEGISKHYFTNK